MISSELLAPASPEEAAQVLSAFGFAEVHVVCTARDLARQIPSVWQENVKTRQSTSFAELLASLRGGNWTTRRGCSGTTRTCLGCCARGARACPPTASTW
ncbi:hypothetical protein ACFSVJ_01075 [Prauserella oleivorans]